MYSWIWNKLPGPKWLKVVQSTILTAAFVALLFFVVFPAIDAFFQDPTLG